MMVPREEVRRMEPSFLTCCDFGLSALETGEVAERSGEALSGGESLCLGSSLPSEPFPSSCVGLAAGLEHRDVVGPGKEEEAEAAAAAAAEEGEAELLWFPRKSWYGTVARMGCSRTALPLLALPPLLPHAGEDAVGEASPLRPRFTRCCAELVADADDVDIIPNHRHHRHHHSSTFLDSTCGIGT